jgi:hypothetical protein
VLGDQPSRLAAEAPPELFKAGKWLTDTKVTTPLERSGWAQVDSRLGGPWSGTRPPTCSTTPRSPPAAGVPPEILDRERLAQRMTARVAHRGLRIDGEHVDRLCCRAAARGPGADAGPRLKVRRAEPRQRPAGRRGAAVHLGAQLPRTATGRPSVAAGVLEPFRRVTDLGAFVRARLDYQKAETAIGLFLEPYRELVEHGDGRARPTVYTLGADTGRMSCVRPNLQQVPREGGFRACITADPGHVLVSADFANVEIRVAGRAVRRPHLRAILRPTPRAATCTGRSPGSPSARTPPRPTGTPSSAASSAGSTAAASTAWPAPTVADGRWPRPSSTPWTRCCPG